MKKTGITFLAILFVFALFAGQALADQQRGQTGAQQTYQMGGATGAYTHDINRTSEIQGRNVQNPQGEDLGQVNDLVFDKEGNISYLILSRGGVMGVGADLVPVPWKEDKITIQEDNVILSMDKQRLDQAPSFSSGEWDQMSQQEFQQRVHGYYGHDMREGMTPDMHRREGMTPDMHRREGVSPDAQRQEGLSPDAQRQEGITPGTPRRDSVTPYDQRFPERAPTGRGTGE
jgi:sporulation protein YlmC with PRC-barrel domain